MNLLPKSREEFSQKEYWDSFFKKRGTKAFEWYGEYPELSTYLHKYIKPKDNILITGCGNSTLGRDLYDIGFSKVTNIDISNVVIRQMLAQTEKERPGLKYLQMDALEMSFDDEAFSVVLDKGTLDALMPDATSETITKISKYFSEIQRTLKKSGRYICISLLQEHILTFLLDYFPSRHFMFRIVRCVEAENSMAVFMVICTKFQNLPRPILEIGNNEKMNRYETASEIISQIKSIQQAAFICTNLKRSKIPQNEVCIDLYQVDSSDVRFSVYIVDAPFEGKNSEYAAFIVPQGRESEWLFATKAGRQHLTKMTGMNRLAIVTMHRNHKYGSFDELQHELDGAICNFAPANLKKQKIPYLSLGGDVGTRTTVHRGASAFSGDYVIEDVLVDGVKFRRLFFLSSQLVVQSEAKLKVLKSKKEIVDLNHLTCKHHVYMILASLLAEQRICVIGLGGGGLCSFLNRFQPEFKIVAVEIDAEMLDVATNFFGLTKSQNLEVVIQDGVEFLGEMATRCERFDAILFDVDSKDSTIGMSCPPQQFLDNDVLDNVGTILGDNGIFILNLVIRESTLRPPIIENLKKKFKTVVSYQLAEDLNEIVVCSNSTRTSIDTIKKSWDQGSEKLNRYFKKTHSTNEIDLNELLNHLTIL